MGVLGECSRGGLMAKFFGASNCFAFDWFLWFFLVGSDELFSSLSLVFGIFYFLSGYLSIVSDVQCIVWARFRVYVVSVGDDPPSSLLVFVCCFGVLCAFVFVSCGEC